MQVLDEECHLNGRMPLRSRVEGLQTVPGQSASPRPGIACDILWGGPQTKFGW